MSTHSSPTLLVHVSARMKGKRLRHLGNCRWRDLASMLIDTKWPRHLVTCGREHVKAGGAVVYGGTAGELIVRPAGESP